MRKLTAKETRLKQYFLSIAKTLGPEWSDEKGCKSNKCHGCKYEMSDALGTAIYALRREFGMKKKDI